MYVGGFFVTFFFLWGGGGLFHHVRAFFATFSLYGGPFSPCEGLSVTFSLCGGSFSYYEGLFWASPFPTKMFEGTHAPPLRAPIPPPAGAWHAPPMGAHAYAYSYMCLIISIIEYTISNFLKYV